MYNTEKSFGEEYKSKLLKTLEFTVEFLNKHNLRWFIGQGSCIGAIRHQGLIPWDDDIDLLMPRDDYNKLLSLQTELDRTQYELVSWDKGHYPSPFAKMVDRNTTLWELKSLPFITGVFVDIFPMDLSDKTPSIIVSDLKRYDRLLNLYWSSISVYSLKEIFNLLLGKHIRYFLLGLLSVFTYSHKDGILKKLKQQDVEHNCEEGEYYVLFSSCFAYKYEKEIFKREWFDDYCLMPFEGIRVRVPKGYDAYLTHVYGDYMQLPPEEKRITRHYHYYMNLNERKTIQEIVQIKKCEGV